MYGHSKPMRESQSSFLCITFISSLRYSLEHLRERLRREDVPVAGVGLEGGDVAAAIVLEVVVQVPTDFSFL